MPVLVIEHDISDFEIWCGAFRRFAGRREEAGVTHERILRPADDPRHVMVELEFGTLEAARGFLVFLETQVWSTPANSPALVGSPRAVVALVEPTSAD